ncbi:MAG: hypothetical protein JRN39_01165 [Nitrososphaerota archaeon]|nr:hypothetical protein [Nitrososphaerota archaeon]
MMGSELGSEQKQMIYTVEHCDACDINNKRAFQKGDYVIKKSGKCPKCGAEMVIMSIYAEALKR